MEVARRWADPRGGTDTAGLAALGAAPATLAEAAARTPPPLPVAAANWPAVRVFLAADTQWRTAGMSGQPIGLDYVALHLAARALGVRWTARLLWRLRVIEAEALAALAERRERARE